MPWLLAFPFSKPEAGTKQRWMNPQKMDCLLHAAPAHSPEAFPVPAMPGHAHLARLGWDHSWAPFLPRDGKGHLPRDGKGWESYWRRGTFYSAGHQHLPSPKQLQENQDDNQKEIWLGTYVSRSSSPNPALPLKALPASELDQLTQGSIQMEFELSFPQGYKFSQMLWATRPHV